MFVCVCAFYLEIALRNAVIIVMVTFGAHSIKDILRVQLARATTLYAATGEERNPKTGQKRNDSTSRTNVCARKYSFQRRKHAYRQIER